MLGILLPQSMVGSQKKISVGTMGWTGEGTADLISGEANRQTVKQDVVWRRLTFLDVVACPTLPIIHVQGHKRRVVQGLGGDGRQGRRPGALITHTLHYE